MTDHRRTVQTGSYSPIRGLRAGAVGGFVGSLVLGALAGLGAIALNQEVFYVSVAKVLGLGSPDVTGWTLHFLTGIVAGGGVFRKKKVEKRGFSGHKRWEVLVWFVGR